MTHARPVMLTLLSLALLGGCEREPEVDLPPLTLHGTYVSMGVDGDALPCAGSIPWMDRHVETLGAMFERDVSEVSIGYYWLRKESLRPECGLGCTYSENEINAVVANSTHEIAHAVTSHWVGRGDTFFNEGNAVATSDFIYGVGKPDKAEQIREMIGADRSVDVHYPTAGTFVTYLFNTWDPPTFLEFYAQTSRDSDYAAVAAAFEAVYGVELDAVIDDFLALADDPGVCLELVPACTLDPIPWTGDKWTATIEVSCAGEALGPDRGPDVDNGDFWQFAAVDIPADGDYLLTSSTVPMTFFPCGPCAERGESARTSQFSEPGLESTMLAGRYIVRLRGLPGADVVHELTIEPAP